MISRGASRGRAKREVKRSPQKKRRKAWNQGADETIREGDRFSLERRTSGQAARRHLKEEERQGEGGRWRETRIGPRNSCGGRRATGSIGKPNQSTTVWGAIGKRGDNVFGNPAGLEHGAGALGPRPWSRKRSRPSGEVASSSLLVSTDALLDSGEAGKGSDPWRREITRPNVTKSGR